MFFETPSHHNDVIDVHKADVPLQAWKTLGELAKPKLKTLKTKLALQRPAEDARNYSNPKWRAHQVFTEEAGPAKWRVASYGSFVWVASPPSGGSTITLRLCHRTVAKHHRGMSATNNGTPTEYCTADLTD